jgi:DNA-binding SARP family transcriptional activator/tetratricopeptide (TPR) repeat protein
LPESVVQSERTRVQLCGRLSVKLDGVELAGDLRGRQVPLLLAYLVLSRRRAVGREELIGALWPESAPQSQDAALRTLLSRLRSAIGRDLLSGRDELLLELPEPAWIDVEVALAEMARAQRALEHGDVRSAWVLAQSPLEIAGRGLLPGIQAPWVEPRRQELADVRLTALEVIGRAGLRLGSAQLGSVRGAARTLIEIEPYRESGYVLLMSALEREGNVAEGLRVFERLRALLREELGTLPSPDAMAAHDRLLHPGASGNGPREQAVSAAGGIELAPALAARGTEPLVGRRSELDQLDAWWRLTGGERMLLLAGEAGIGKTRLLAEAARRAHEAGAVVLAGAAAEETLVPYQPFLEALGHYVARAGSAQLRGVAREYGAELARLIPELRRRMPELEPTEPTDPEIDRYRLFESVAGLLGAIAASAPVLLVLDDLHWSDRPTLLLLRHLARSPHAAGLSILGAYRPSERPHEGFEEALAMLRHDRLAATLTIGGLAAEATTELVALRSGGTPSLAFVRALHEETEGNPFFIEEMVRHLVDSGVRSELAGASDLARVGLPQDVRDVISRRLGRLHDGVIDWLRAAAVLGRDFDSALLERVLGLQEERFLAALEDVLQAGLVAETPGGRGRYSFSHALIRETLYEGMSSTRRARIHHRVGVALEHDGVDRHVGELAHHFTRADDPEDAERAIRYALRAGREATSMLAHEEAAEHYERALEVLERADPDALDRRCELLLELGEARERGGERPRAWPVFREAASIAARLGDRDALIRAAIGASRRYLQPPGVVDEELIALLEQALEATAGERSVTRLRLLSRLCGVLYYSERREWMLALSDEASVLAAELGDPLAIALAAAARRRAHWGPGLSRGLQDSRELLRAAIEAADPELELQGHAWMVVDLLARGDRDGAEIEIEAFTTGAVQLRQPMFTWNAGVWRAMTALLDGRLEEAEQLAGAALSTGIRSDQVAASQYYAIQLAAIRREQARMPELEAAVRELVADNPGRPAYRAGLAALLCDAGRRDEALAELDAIDRADLATIPRDGDWLTAVMLLAEVAAELGATAAAASAYELLTPFADTVVVIGLGAVCHGATARQLGRLALTLGRPEQARAHLLRAVAVDTALRAPALLAHSRLDCALALGPGPQARELVAAARATAAELGLVRVARRVEALRDH